MLGATKNENCLAAIDSGIRQTGTHEQPKEGTGRIVLAPTSITARPAPAPRHELEAGTKSGTILSGIIINQRQAKHAITKVQKVSDSLTVGGDAYLAHWLRVPRMGKSERP